MLMAVSEDEGITWSPLYRGTKEVPETAERIDRLYLRHAEAAAPQLVPIAATVLPELWEDASIPEAERAFPSDHGALVIDLTWSTAADEE